MKALIGRLEQAEEGSRALDKMIACAVLDAGGTIRLEGMADDEPSITGFGYPDGSTGTALRYTTSLDAALTLVPEGWRLAGLWEAVDKKDRPWWGSNVNRDEPRYKMIHGARGAKTPALALTIASIKAMETTG